MVGQKEAAATVTMIIKHERPMHVRFDYTHGHVQEQDGLKVEFGNTLLCCEFLVWSRVIPTVTPDGEPKRPP